MNQLVFIEHDQAVTDSLTVADVFGKNHKEVLRDIDNQMNKLSEALEKDFTERNFAPSAYKDGSGKNNRKISLTEDAFTLIAMSYTTIEAMQMKVRFIQEFKRMREVLNNPKTQLEIMQASILELMKHEKRIKGVEKKLIDLVGQSLPLSTPTIEKEKSNAPITEIAKEYGVSGYRLNKWLGECGIQYRKKGHWSLYKRYTSRGYTCGKQVSAWTKKGRELIYRTLKKKKGIAPVDKREVEAS